ncbi:acyl-CoA thioesterase [Neptunomonas antarctica]|uniref:acyl-CoA thioesterase n=1 Tax=Neptunomonas antarctica TaxID=619304 RepID=UPI001EE4CD8F|nr:thioesterase family protein [Neptunomonas antarctica]
MTETNLGKNSMNEHSTQQKPAFKKRSDYPHFITIPTRWMDNDVYGHVNNVQYYSYFDTAVNRYLIDQGVLDIYHSDVIGLVVETQCNYFRSIAFPEDIIVGVAVSKLGNSSVRYEIGLFKDDGEDAAAHGHFIHVYVDRTSQRPVALPTALRAALEQISVGG